MQVSKEIKFIYRRIMNQLPQHEKDKYTDRHFIPLKILLITNLVTNLAFQARLLGVKR